MEEHICGRCDICHKDITGVYGGHGIIHDIDMITRYCDECWDKENE